MRAFVLLLLLPAVALAQPTPTPSSVPLTVNKTTGAVTGPVSASTFLAANPPASITAPASTSLTLSGGSSGASLVLGQGTDQIGSFTGRLFVGTATPALPTQWNSLYVLTPTITSNVGRGINVTTTYGGSNAATGYNSYLFTSGSNNMDHMHGYQSTVYHGGSGTLARSAAYQAYLESTGGGSVTLGIGYYFAGLATSGGGTFGENWAFYDVGGSPTRHSGKVYIGEALIGSSALPNTQLYVTRSHATVGGGLSQPTAAFRSTNTAAVGVGGSLALGGESGAASTPYSFAFLLGAKEQSGATYNGYLGFFTTNSDSNNSEKARITSAGNLLVGTTTDPSGSGAISVAGTVTTGAPTGGAGAWKLGVANTVSPTSPNRTITIEIGGVTYYLAAKTTND